MRNLIHSNLFRLSRSRYYWLMFGGALLAGLLMLLFGAPALDALADEYTVEEVAKNLWIYTNVGALLLAYLATLLTVSMDSTEYQDGGLRNKLVAGSTRGSTFMAALVIEILAVLSMLCAYYLPVFPLYSLWEAFSADLGSHTPVQTLTTAVLTVVCFTCLMHLLCVGVPGKSSMILGPVLIIGLVCVSLTLAAAYNEPETYTATEGMVIDANGEVDMSNATEEEIPNPAYIPDRVRGYYEFWIHALPTGAGIAALTEMNGVEMNGAEIFWMYLASESILFCVAGALFFRRRNLL